MKVLLVQWKAYGQELLKSGLERMGIAVDTIFFDIQKFGNGEKSGFIPTLCEKMQQEQYAFVISFNFFAAVSVACKECDIRYVAWTVDSPLYTMYTRAVFNSCNYLFVFDKLSLKELQALGVQNVWYLPLASGTDFFDQVIEGGKSHSKWMSDVSFVGSLYTERSAYKLLGDKKDYFAGYMEGLVESQRNIWGYTFVEEILKETWSEQLQKILNSKNDEDYIGSSEKVFANSCILVEVTARERQAYLQYISQFVDVDVYTGSDTSELSNIHNKGKVDYITEMPLVFHNSKINLNITLRSIQQGISLRVWDVLACGGFLLTNYQPELEDFFTIGRDLECYTSKEEMLYKIEYYLEHEEERREIARNGYEKVKELHGYTQRIESILEIMNG